jgi:hypothetical protein
MIALGEVISFIGWCEVWSLIAAVLLGCLGGQIVRPAIVSFGLWKSLYWFCFRET